MLYSTTVLFGVLTIAGGAGDTTTDRAVGDAPPAASAADPEATEAEAVPLDPTKPETMTEVLAQLESEDKSEREAAYGRLRKLDPEPTGPLVAPYLSSPNPETRKITLRLVRVMEYPKAYAQITRLLSKDRDPEVRREASHALTALHPESAVRYLKTAATMDSELMVRRAAILDLGELTSLPADEALLDVYLDARDADDPYLLKIALRGLTVGTGKSFGDSPELWVGYIDSLRAREDADPPDTSEEGDDESED